MVKGLGIFLLSIATLVGADLITTFDFDIEESELLSYTRPGWGNEAEGSTTDDTFYYNLVLFTVDTGGDWRAANNSITSHDSFDYTLPGREQAVQTNGPWYAADTYIYLYDDVFNPTARYLKASALCEVQSCTGLFLTSPLSVVLHRY